MGTVIVSAGTLGAGLMVLGLFTSVSGPVAALGVLYASGLNQSFTKVNHGGLFEVWLVMLLACTRCGDGLSLQALYHTWRQGRPRLSLQVTPSLVYSLPFRVSWILLGVAYFFPGFWKLWKAGDQWISGEALLGRLPSNAPGAPQVLFSIHEYHLLLVALGVATLVFELGFIFLIFSRFARWLAPLIGLGFHLGVWVSMGIGFSSMMKMYVVFIDAEALLKRCGTRISITTRENLGLTLGDPSAHHPLAVRAAGPALPTLIVGTALVAGNIWAGAFAIDSWPFAAFPLFSRRVSTTTFRYCSNAAAVDSGGTTTRVNPRELKWPMGGVRFTYLLNKLVRTKEPKRRAALFEATAAVLRASKVNIGKGDRLAIERYCTDAQGQTSYERVADHQVQNDGERRSSDKKAVK